MIKNMEIINLWVEINHKQENGVGIKLISKREVNLTGKSYSGKSIRLKIDEFEKPTKPIGFDKLGYYIWTTEENAHNAIKKCIDLIMSDFEELDKKWNETKEGISKIKTALSKGK